MHVPLNLIQGQYGERIAGATHKFIWPRHCWRDQQPLSPRMHRLSNKMRKIGDEEKQSYLPNKLKLYFNYKLKSEHQLKSSVMKKKKTKLNKKREQFQSK